VDGYDYLPPFRFTGKFIKLTVNLKPEPMSAEERRKWDEGVKQFYLGAQ
jgi:hypothetical protein